MQTTKKRPGIRGLTLPAIPPKLSGAKKKSCEIYEEGSWKTRGEAKGLLLCVSFRINNQIKKFCPWINGACRGTACRSSRDSSPVTWSKPIPPAATEDWRVYIKYFFKASPLWRAYLNRLKSWGWKGEAEVVLKDHTQRFTVSHDFTSRRGEGWNDRLLHRLWRRLQSGNWQSLRGHSCTPIVSIQGVDFDSLAIAWTHNVAGFSLYV